MVQVTERDERIVEWLRTVRVADMETLRLAFGAFAEHADDDAPSVPTLRYVQARVSKLVDGGVLGRARPTYREGSVVWATRAYTGRDAPSLFRQTLRHELCVSRISAEFLLNGYEWAEDPKPTSKHEHRADGVATYDGSHVELVEVELTPKTTAGRYRAIMRDHDRRLATAGVSYVRYYCDPITADRVSREIRQHVPHRAAADAAADGGGELAIGDGRITVHPVFDRYGRRVERSGA